MLLKGEKIEAYHGYWKNSVFLSVSFLPPSCLCLSLSLSPLSGVCVFWVELHNQRLDSLTVAENPVAVYPKKLEASEQKGNGTVAVQGWGVVVLRRLHGERPHWKLKELEPLSLQHQVHSGRRWNLQCQLVSSSTLSYRPQAYLMLPIFQNSAFPFDHGPTWQSFHTLADSNQMCASVILGIS